MDNINNTLNTRKFKHLNDFERGQIELLYNEGLSAYAIAKRLNRASNTIRNEIKRGLTTQYKANKKVEIYYPDVAKTKYIKARKSTGRKFKVAKCLDFLKYVNDYFYNKRWSLAAIVGYVKANNLFSYDEMVCFKTLYNYVDNGFISIKNTDLPMKLRYNLKSYKVRKYKNNLGKSIDLRPEAIESREEFGHWEIDTVIGHKTKEDPVLLTLVERKTRNTIIKKIENKDTESVNKALDQIFNEFKEKKNKVFKSITSDNGLEFANLSIYENSNIDIYYTHPYSSFERGTNERHNGLIRRFIKKGTALKDISLDFIFWICEWMNSLPRKIHNYRSPENLFEKELDIIHSIK